MVRRKVLVEATKGIWRAMRRRKSVHGKALGEPNEGNAENSEEMELGGLCYMSL